MKKFYLLLAASMVALFSNAQSRLPNVTLKDITGKSVRVDTLSNNGKPLVVAFFATWCKPCNRELKAIDEVYDDWKRETGVKIVAVSIDQAQNINKVKPLVDVRRATRSQWGTETRLGRADDTLHLAARRQGAHCV